MNLYQSYADADVSLRIIFTFVFFLLSKVFHIKTWSSSADWRNSTAVISDLLFVILLFTLIINLILIFDSL